MAKGYWITFSHTVPDPAQPAEYAALAGLAVEVGNGRPASTEPALATAQPRGQDSRRSRCGVQPRLLQPSSGSRSSLE